MSKAASKHVAAHKAAIAAGGPHGISAKTAPARASGAGKQPMPAKKPANKGGY